MAWALLAQHYGRLNTTTGYVVYIYWICGICHAANVQTEGMVLIFIYYYVRVRTCRTAWALQAACSVAPIRTHSNNLQYWKAPKNLNRRMAWWHTNLQEYDFKIHYIPRKTNTGPDILS